MEKKIKLFSLRNRNGHYKCLGIKKGNGTLGIKHSYKTFLQNILTKHSYKNSGPPTTYNILFYLNCPNLISISTEHKSKILDTTEDGRC